MKRRTLPVLGSMMSFIEAGSGPLVLFLHGNPTSSYLWRNIAPAVAAHGYRAIAVDLIGMGASGASDRGYRLIDHLAYLETFLDELAVKRLTLVGHDWGGVLALALARSRPDQVRGVSILEAHIHPIDSWSDLPGPDREMFSRLRAEGSGEQTVLEENFFVEVVLPSGIVRSLTREDHDRYRAPFPDPASRAPILQWVREIPIAGNPSDVADVIRENLDVFRDPALPTLLIHGTPGAIIGTAELAWCSAHGQSMTFAAVGAGTHFLPEDRPGEIVSALASWLTAAS
ncbi:haloalkane dehalogenase [Rhodococcus sp. H29-C3]|uniref:haloalkane dehalogenase n=1 Tax=Rhodococcus sp. H29-C3 TaxID=3046307 RepID=UPI0024BB4674|nr:haloalkane dehalogenase [Rhodococcus sp. H29-C3]MDJ0363237.1 haloalkane dehalogenase [Rhodococcus sp. H29-C3]